MNDTASVTYGGYLHLPELLACQQPQTDRHDEMLFIILHQTMELWMKQVLFEIDAAQATIAEGELVPAYKGLARVSRIQALMTQAWDILATMTPADYLGFRAALGTSSGFQSAQFRTLEYRLGLKDEAFLKFQDGNFARTPRHGAVRSTCPAFTTKRSRSWPRPGSRFPKRCWSGRGAQPMWRTTRWRPHGPKCIATRTNIGRNISSPKNFSISTTRC